MIDIRDLLHEAAPAPRRPFDVDGVATRAARRGLWRRVLAWATVLGAAVSLAFPLESALVPAGHGGTTVESVRPSLLPDRSTPAAGTPRGTPARAARDARLGAPGTSGTSREVVAAGPTGAPAKGRPTPSGAVDECIVQGGDVGVDIPNAGGAGIGGFPTCDYTAAAPAGYAAFASSWEVDVTGVDGSQRVYGPRQQAAPPAHACGPVGVIKPGDHVHVVLYTGAENTASVESVKVGPTHHC
ncbi:MAG: hypothetical protein ACYDH6_20685 [Acidimicrobiales bacterium]